MAEWNSWWPNYEERNIYWVYTKQKSKYCFVVFAFLISYQSILSPVIIFLNISRGMFQVKLWTLRSHTQKHNDKKYKENLLCSFVRGIILTSRIRNKLPWKNTDWADIYHNISLCHFMNIWSFYSTITTRFVFHKMKMTICFWCTFLVYCRNFMRG